jgi:hypothetical protein
VINTDGSDRKELTSGTNIPPQFALSPDGKRIAFVDTSNELNVINADGSGLRRLTHSPGPSSVALPTWSPDSEKLAYSCPFEDPLHAHRSLRDQRRWNRDEAYRLQGSPRGDPGRSFMGQGVEMMCPRVSGTKAQTGPRSFFMVYSPECVEGAFCELRVDGVLGS